MNASPIEGAVIRLREGWNSQDGEYVTSIQGTEYLTDETGHCNIAMSAGRYTAEVWKNGYKVGYYNVVSDKNVTMQYISMPNLSFFDAPNTKSEAPVMLKNAYVTVTMADGTVYEMSFPEGNRGSSWSIFQIENGTFRVLDIVKEILATHR